MQVNISDQGSSQSPSYKTARTSARYWPETLVLYRMRVSRRGVNGGEELRARSVKPLKVAARFAADAGVMQIQLSEGMGLAPQLGCAGEHGCQR